MNVVIRKGQLDYFRRKARRNPNEIMAVLIGLTIPTEPLVTVIARIEYPELKISTPSEVEISEDVLDAVHARAVSEGLGIVGFIHSHPDWMPVLSHTDYTQFDDNGCVLVGICEVQQQCRTRVVFWTKGSSLPCNVVYKD